jgi:cysteine-rich repeat protein
VGRVENDVACLDGDGVRLRFETGDLSWLGWTSDPTYGFAPFRARPRTGTWALGPANSGVSSSVARVTLNAATTGRVCFWYAGESESCCDHFRFLVDGAVELSASGAHATWTEFCTDVAAGSHELVWSYQKDASINTGWDGFWIDNLVLPGTFTETCDDGNTVAGDGCSSTCRAK